MTNEVKVPGAAFKRIENAVIMRTSGDAGLRLLRRLVSEDAEGFAQGEVFRAAMLNASGGVMQEVRVASGGNVWECAFTSETADTGLAWARQVSISFDAEVTSDAGESAFWLGGCDRNAALEKAGFPVAREGRFTEAEGVRFSFYEDAVLATGSRPALDAAAAKLAEAGAAEADGEAWELMRVAACRPAYGMDYDESSCPLESGFERCVNFSDPARMFIGRALTEARSRAGVRCRLGLLRIETPYSAEEIESEPAVSFEGNAEEGGVITSWVKESAGSVLALSLLPVSVREGAKAEVTAEAEGREQSFSASVIRFS